MSGILDRMGRFDMSSNFKKWNLAAAAEALAIANSTLLLGLFLYQFINPGEFAFILFLVDPDISLIGIIIIWALMISNTTGFFLLVLGWVVAGIYTKRKYGAQSTGILLKGSAIPAALLFFTAGMVILSLIFVPFLGFLVIIQILLIIVVLLVFSLIFTIFGIIVSQFISFNSDYEYNFSIEKDYLVLEVLPDEKVSHCPFRSDLPGCSYLGYKAPDKALICDYESTYLRCRVYSHIYKQHMEAEL